MNDAELAAHLAEVAGKLLLQVRASGRVLGQGARQGRRRDCQPVPRPCASARRGRDDGLLSEEMKDDGTRLSAVIAKILTHLNSPARALPRSAAQAFDLFQAA